MSNIYHHAHSWFRGEDFTKEERRCIICGAGAVHVSRNKNSPPCGHLKVAGPKMCPDCKKNHEAGWLFWTQDSPEPIKYPTLPRWSVIKDAEQIKQIQKAAVGCVTENNKEIGEMHRIIISSQRTLTENRKKLAFLRQVRISMRSRRKMEMRKNS